MSNYLAFDCVYGVDLDTRADTVETDCKRQPGEERIFKYEIVFAGIFVIVIVLAWRDLIHAYFFGELREIDIQFKIMTYTLFITLLMLILIFLMVEVINPMFDNKVSTNNKASDSIKKSMVGKGCIKNEKKKSKFDKGCIKNEKKKSKADNGHSKNKIILHKAKNSKSKKYNSQHNGNSN